MKLHIRILVFLIFIIGLVSLSTNHAEIVYASKNTTITALDTTPVPAQISIEATATVDPASIGNTSGVIAIGIIVVFIILAGVIWGSLEIRRESLKNSKPRE